MNTAIESLVARKLSKRETNSSLRTTRLDAEFRVYGRFVADKNLGERESGDRYKSLENVISCEVFRA